MLFAAFAVIAFGIILGLLAPPFGFAPLIIGIILLGVYFFAGVGKRVAESDPKR
jgi:hypothetical protein